MDYTMEHTISLIYCWLKENNLSKTCLCLEEEYGNAIKKVDNGSVSLKKIIEIYQAMSVCLSGLSALLSLGQLANKVKAKPATVNRRRKNSTSKKPGETTGNEVKVDPNKNIAPVAKKKKGPVFPPGVWVCPESETALYDAYERTAHTVYERIEEERIAHAELLKTIAAASTIDQIETGEGNINSNIQFSNKGNKDVENLNMFTSDSEMDSSDDDIQVSKSPVKTFNNNILSSSTSMSKQAKQVEEVQKTLSKSGRPQVEHTKGKHADTPNRLGCDTNVVNNNMTIEIITKKKAKKLMPKVPKVFDDSNRVDVTEKTSQSNTNDLHGMDCKAESNSKKKKKKVKPDNDIVCSQDSGLEDDFCGSPNIDTQKKKKKKQKSNTENDEFSQDLVITNGSPNVESVIKKKKKKHKRSIEDNESNQTGIIANVIEEAHNIVNGKRKKKRGKFDIEDNESNTENTENKLYNDNPERKTIEKKKKKKSKNEAKFIDEVVTVLTTEPTITNSESIGNDASLNILGNVLKKKKKKKHVDAGP